MPSPYYPFKSLTGRGRYFFSPLEPKKQRSQKKKRLISGYLIPRTQFRAAKAFRVTGPRENVRPRQKSSKGRQIMRGDGLQDQCFAFQG